MFGKKCSQCGGDINKKHKYCSTCGSPLQKEEDFGMLGREDIFDDQIKFPMGFNMIFNSLIKNLDKQFQNMDREVIKHTPDPKIKKGGISISISTSPGKEPQIKINSFGGGPMLEQSSHPVKKELKLVKKLPRTNIKIGKLPKKEPTTNIRRLSDKVIYEINIPGVKSLKDVSIIQLENSIEIKALAKDKAYIKLIPIGLPILDYSLDKGKLVLELEAKN